MGEEDGFVRAVQVAPGDDSLRLVYADWLEERGDPRAEYLRVLCALRGPLPPQGRKPALRARLKELRTGLDPSWIAAMGHPTPVVRWTVPANLPCYGDYDFRM